MDRQLLPGNGAWSLPGLHLAWAGPCLPQHTIDDMRLPGGEVQLSAVFRRPVRSESLPAMASSCALYIRVRWFEKIFSWRLNYLTRYQDKCSGLPGKPWGGSLYPPQTSPRWQNFSWYSGKVIFFRFLFFSWIRRFHTQSYLPQLPRKTLWMWWIRPLLLFIPPTSVGIMTEKLKIFNLR